MNQPLTQPTPAQIVEARQYASLTQSQAAQLVHARNYNTWANWEAAAGDPRARAIPLSAWELFLVKTNQRSIDRFELERVRAGADVKPARRPSTRPQRSGGLHRRDRRRPR